MQCLELQPKLFERLRGLWELGRARLAQIAAWSAFMLCECKPAEESESDA